MFSYATPYDKAEYCEKHGIPEPCPGCMQDYLATLPDAECEGPGI